MTAPVSPVALAVAPNGGRRTQADHPAIPITASELAATAIACRDAGAAMIHIHVRDSQQRHSLDAEAFRTAIATIHNAVGHSLVVQMTTESLGLYAPAEQMATVKAVKPEAISLALREFAPTPADVPALADFLVWLRQERILPQFILYSPEDLARLDDLHQAGMIPWDDPPVLFVLGRYTVGQTSQPTDVLPFLAEPLRRPGHWMTCAFGAHEIACVTAAALMGGHIRVGFENNLTLPDGTPAPDNAALVVAAASALHSCGLSIASADDLRQDWLHRCA